MTTLDGSDRRARPQRRRRGRARPRGAGHVAVRRSSSSLVFTAYFCVYLYSRTQHERAFLDAQSALDLRSASSTRSSCSRARGRSPAACSTPGPGGTEPPADRFPTGGLGAVFLGTQDRRVGAPDPRRTHVHQQRLHPALLLPHARSTRSTCSSASSCSACSSTSCPTRAGDRQHTIETCSTYWHTVDLFWVLIFALLYVVR